MRDVSRVGGRHERIEKTSSLGGIRGHPSAIRDVLPSATHHLPRVGLFKPEDVRDVAVWVIERFSKNVGCSLRRRQFLQQQQDPCLEPLGSFRSQARISVGIGSFRQPGSDVRLSPRACRLHDVDRQSCRCGHEECLGVPNLAAVCDLPAYPDVLHDVLRFRRMSQHPVDDAEETRPHVHEQRESVVVGADLFASVEIRLVHADDWSIGPRVDLLHDGVDRYQGMGDVRGLVRFVETADDRQEDRNGRSAAGQTVGAVRSPSLDAMVTRAGRESAFILRIN